MAIKIGNIDKPRKLVKENPGLTLEKITKKSEVTMSIMIGSACSERTQYHQEKKTCGLEERHEEQRQAFLDKLSAYHKEDLIYIDRAGIDSNERYPYG